MKAKKLFVCLLASAIFIMSGCTCSSGNIALENESTVGISGNDTVTDTESFISIDAIPAYSGTAYIVLNGNQPDFSDADKQRTDAFEIYSELDTLGRCGTAYANICPELQPTEERGEIGQIKPSGWHTVKYNDLIDGNYLYNRCHLIGYQLAGENANERNLITGARYLNVVGMLPFEDKVDDYVDETRNHVLYRVTPIFEGDNLVASGVHMEAWSVEDEENGICFNVYCYNVQPGIEIDYATGDSWISEDTTTTTNDANGTANVDNTAEESSSLVDAQTERSQANTSSDYTETRDYILNKNTKKIHLASCSSVNDIAEKNKEAYNGTLEEIENQGYSPCKRCLN